MCFILFCFLRERGERKEKESKGSIAVREEHQLVAFGTHAL